MFNVDIKRNRVVIQHTVRALDGRVDLTTTVDFGNASEDKVLLWAATNRLTHWLDSVPTNRLTRAEVKKRFDDLVIECKGHFQTDEEPSSWERKVILDNFSKVWGKGVSMGTVLQSLVRSSLKFAH